MLTRGVTPQAGFSHFFKQYPFGIQGLVGSHSVFSIFSPELRNQGFVPVRQLNHCSPRGFERVKLLAREDVVALPVLRREEKGADPSRLRCQHHKS